MEQGADCDVVLRDHRQPVRPDCRHPRGSDSRRISRKHRRRLPLSFAFASRLVVGSLPRPLRAAGTPARQQRLWRNGAMTRKNSVARVRRSPVRKFNPGTLQSRPGGGGSVRGQKPRARYRARNSAWEHRIAFLPACHGRCSSRQRKNDAAGSRRGGTAYKRQVLPIPVARSLHGREPRNIRCGGLLVGDALPSGKRECSKSPGTCAGAARNSCGFIRMLARASPGGPCPRRGSQRGGTHRPEAGADGSRTCKRSVQVSTTISAGSFEHRSSLSPRS